MRFEISNLRLQYFLNNPWILHPKKVLEVTLLRTNFFQILFSLVKRWKLFEIWWKNSLFKYLSWSKLSHFVFWLRLGRFRSFSGAILASLTSRISRKPIFYDKIRLFTGFGRIKKIHSFRFLTFRHQNAAMQKKHQSNQNWKNHVYPVFQCDNKNKKNG